MILIFINCSISSLISVLSILISVGALALGVIAYRKFLSKQLKQKQLEIICSLVEKIQSEPNLYLLKKEDKPQVSFWYTLIDIAEMAEIDMEYDRLYFFGKDGEENDEMINWNFYSKYYSNPLLPKKIADKLSVFNITHWHSVKFGNIEHENCILIGRKKIIKPETSCLFIPDSPLYTASGFRSATIDLRNTIQKWLNQYGIKDLNITSSNFAKKKSTV